MDREAYFSRWAELHGGYDPRSNGLVRLWLTWTYVLARPLARTRVPPDLVTLLGLLVSVAAAALAAGGDGWWLLAAALVVVLSALLDNLDGAVAVLAGRATRWGYVLDSVDRPVQRPALRGRAVAGRCAAGGLRRRRGADPAAGVRAGPGRGRRHERGRGRDRVGAADPGDRHGSLPRVARPRSATRGPPLGAWAWVGLGAVGLVQLLVVVRRRLRADGRAAAPVAVAQAGPIRSATIAADRPTSGSPPPGWADPPTRNSPGTGDRLAGRRKAARAPLDEVP